MCSFYKTFYFKKISALEKKRRISTFMKILLDQRIMKICHRYVFNFVVPKCLLDKTFVLTFRECTTLFAVFFQSEITIFFVSVKIILDLIKVLTFLSFSL